MCTDDESRPPARLTVLAGPAGSGKDSVVGLVRARSPLVWVAVSATTRPQRTDEIDGLYHSFVDRLEFQRMIDEGLLLDWTEVAGHLYGIPRAPIDGWLRAGRPVLLPLDPAGARRLRATVPDSRLVLLVVPGVHPDRVVWPEADAVVVHDLVDRAANELVGLLGSSFLAPALPRVSG